MKNDTLERAIEEFDDLFVQESIDRILKFNPPVTLYWSQIMDYWYWMVLVDDTDISLGGWEDKESTIKYCNKHKLSFKTFEHPVLSGQIDGDDLH